MKIAILEWSCGGGLLDSTAGPSCQSLSAEGWQMLNSLADGLKRAGLDVVLPVDLRAIPQTARHTRAHIVDLTRRAPTTFDGVLRRWTEIAAECDYAWVIAPETDGLLPKILQCLQNDGMQLLNCGGEFLRNGSDKRLTAAALTATGIPHPPTVGLAEVDEAWLATTALPNSSVGHSQSNQRWIIKPATGAGGSGQRLVTRAQLLHLRHSAEANPRDPLGPASGTSSLASPLPLASPAPPNTLTAAAWLVQPWWAGQPASCTAIVDARGEPHWLPLVSQDFETPGSACEQSPAFTIADANLARGPTALAPQYVGCTYPGVELPRTAPRGLLEATLDALGPGAYGPVGIDLLFNPITHTWTVIEVNARCTSSLLAMAAAYRGNLVGDIFQLLTRICGKPAAGLPGNLSPFQFRVARD